MDDQMSILGRLIDALQAEGIRHALAGGHAVSAHTRPRLTVDVDLLIDGRRRKAAEESITQAGFVVRAERDVLRVYEGPSAETPAADLLLSDSHAVWAEALRTAEPGSYQGQEVAVATIPALVAMKFIAATNNERPQEDRLQDVSDISRMVKTRWSEAFATEARRLAELAYVGGAADLNKLVSDLLGNCPVTV